MKADTEKTTPAANALIVTYQKRLVLPNARKAGELRMFATGVGDTWFSPAMTPAEFLRP
jgi:hypothetical protein